MWRFLKALFHVLLGLHDWGPYAPIEYSGRGTIYRRKCQSCPAEETVYPSWRKPR